MFFSLAPQRFSSLHRQSPTISPPSIDNHMPTEKSFPLTPRLSLSPVRFPFELHLVERKTWVAAHPKRKTRNRKRYGTPGGLDSSSKREIIYLHYHHHSPPCCSCFPNERKMTEFFGPKFESRISFLVILFYCPHRWIGNISTSSHLLERNHGQSHYLQCYPVYSIHRFFR